MALIDELNRFRRADELPLFKHSDHGTKEVATYTIGTTLKAYAKEAALSLNFALLSDIAELTDAYERDPVKYVAKNEVALTKALRAYANSLGLPRLGGDVPRWLIFTGVGVGLLALSALTASIAKHRKRLPAAQ